MLVGGSDRLDVDELGVPRTAIAHPGGVVPTEGEGASPFRRPGAVIVSDDGLGLAVAERNLADRHGGPSFEGGRHPSE